jgi:hypothetical protein
MSQLATILQAMGTYGKGRWPIIVAVTVVALMLAILSGRSIVATCISIISVLAVFMAIEKWKTPSTPADARHAQFDTEPFRFTSTWRLEDKPNLTAIQDALISLGLRTESSGSRSGSLVMVGGSQLWTRLFGGYFVSLDKLPLRVELSTSHHGDAAWQLELTVSDRFGWALRDASRERRPKMAAARIKDAVDDQLAAKGRLP